jgi:hypothetical protein
VEVHLSVDYERKSVMRQALNSLIHFIQEAREAHLEVASQ